MNDAELDRSLDTWEAPAPPPSVRAGLRARFPRAERRRFVRPRRWLLVLVAATATLAIGMEETRQNPWSSRLVRFLSQMYESSELMITAWPTSGLLAQVSRADPKAYVDGQLVRPPAYASLPGWGTYVWMDVIVPGEGRFSIAFYKPLDVDWSEAGRIHGNVIEFQAGGKRVRIECNHAIVDSDRPVFVHQE